MTPFLRKTILLLGALSSVFLYDCSSKKEGREFGLALYSVQGIHADFPHALESLKEAGVSYLEIANYVPGGNIFGYTPEELSALVSSKGLKLISSNTFGAGMDVENEEQCLEMWKEIIDDHVKMGCQYLALTMNVSWGSIQRCYKVCRMLDAVGEMAKMKGIRFLYHNHNMEFNVIEDTQIPVIEFLLEHTSPELVGLECDTYWVMQGGADPVEFVQKHADRIDMLHLKDYYVLGDSGKVDIEGSLSAFYNAGGERVLIEMEPFSSTEEADKKAKGQFWSAFHYMPLPFSLDTLYAKALQATRLSDDKRREMRPLLDSSLKDIRRSCEYLKGLPCMKKTGMKPTSGPLWGDLLEDDLLSWHIYQSFPFEGNEEAMPMLLQGRGKEMMPIGYDVNKDVQFSVENDGKDKVLHIDGPYYGCVYTKSSYSNYHFSAKYRFGKKKYAPRKDKAMDSGLIYHSQGPCGADPWATWMMGHEFQIIEGGGEDGSSGDYWTIAGSRMMIPSSVISVHAGYGVYSFREDGPLHEIGDKGGGGVCFGEDYASENGDWTQIDLYCFEDKALHFVNGKLKMILSGSSFWDGTENVPLKEGSIQIQSEGAEVFYKDIRINPIEESVFNSLRFESNGALNKR